MFGLIKDLLNKILNPFGYMCTTIYSIETESTKNKYVWLTGNEYHINKKITHKTRIKKIPEIKGEYFNGK